MSSERLKGFLQAVGLLPVARRVNRAAWRIGRAIEPPSPALLLRNAAVRVRGAPDGLPLPPGALVRRVAGTRDLAWFLESGRWAAEAIVELAARGGPPFERCADVLDFGCGCGRVLRHWAGRPHGRLWGSELSAPAVAWCRRTLPFAAVGANGPEPPLEHPDGRFDLVYALSVLTHLPQEAARAWMREFGRILRPGGRLILSLCGEAYRPHMRPAEWADFAAGRPVVRDPERAGTNDCIAFHPAAYVREHLAAGFEVLQHVPEGARGNPYQDLWMVRKGSS
jgi:SAM-dependent methyltransferase